MTLNFHGGVKVDIERFFTDSEIKYIQSCSAICIKTEEDATVRAEVGENVACGTLLGFSEDTPVYSSVSGVFNGVMELEGGFYFVVINEGEDNTVIPFEPETRSLLSMNREDIIASARQFGIIDTRSGMPLWKLIAKAEKCNRLVVDCTDSFAHSAINQRLCIEKTKSVVGGAKVILHAISALKCVFAMEYTKQSAIESLNTVATDKQLFAVAPLEEKYPYGDNALMEAIYVKTLKAGKTPIDEGVLIVGIESVIALYDAMVSGMPQTHRYISVCGSKVGKGGNYKIPRGTTYHDLFIICSAEGCGLVIENSLLSGKPVSGAVSDTTMSIVSIQKTAKKQTECISCGKCAQVCPARLFPAEVLGSKKYPSQNCIACGACDYICPAGIPLLRLIKKRGGNKK